MKRGGKEENRGKRKERVERQNLASYRSCYYHNMARAPRENIEGRKGKEENVACDEDIVSGANHYS